MSGRGYKRPHAIDNRAPPARASSSPQRVPLHKRARREDDDHPANKLPPALRGRVTLPGEHWYRGDDGRAAAAGKVGPGQTDREHDHACKQQSSKGRGAARGEQQPKNTKMQSGEPAEKGPAGHGGRRSTPERPGRSQARCYDMSSGHGSSRDGAVKGRGSGSSGSSRRPRSPTPSDRLHNPSGLVHGISGAGPARPRSGEGRSIRVAECGRGDRRADAGRRGGSTRSEEGTCHEHGHVGYRLSGRAGEQRSRPNSYKGQGEGSDRKRHASGPGERLSGQGRQQSQSGPAAADAANKQQPSSPQQSSPVCEEGEALPTPTAEAATAAARNSQPEEGQQQHTVMDVVYPASGGPETGGLGRNSHQPIKFTLQKLPSVSAEDLKPKHSSKYSSPSETLAGAPSMLKEQLPSRRESKEHQSSQQQQQQFKQERRQQEEQHHQQRHASAAHSRRDNDVTLDKNSRHTVTGKLEHSSDCQDPQQQHQRPRGEVTRQQEEAGSRRREPSRELSEDTSRDHSGTGHSSRLQHVQDSDRPAASSQSGHKASSTPSERVVTAAEARSRHVAATPGKTADADRQAQQQQEQHSSIHVTSGSRMSCAAIAYVAPGVLSGQSAMCAEGQARTSAVQDRQKGLVALQLRGLPISRQLCFVETWEKLLEVTRTHPDAIDSDHVAMHRRAVAAKAVSGRVCRHLLPLLPLLRAPAAGNNEEQHLRHLQEAIDRYTEDRTAANCVRLADGGSMWLQ